MLKTSSEAFPASRKLMSDIPYVVRVEFRELSHEAHKIVGKPIACSKCNGFLLSVDQIQTDSKVGKYFNCTFCGTLNIIQGEVLVAGTETDFVIEPPPKVATKTGPATSAGGSLLAVIDVSGSMAGANLAAVKRSLLTTVDSLAANAPDTLFGLIEFESSVVIRNLESGEGIILPRESFASLDAIVDSTKRLMDKIKLSNVGKKADSIKRHVSDLRDQGGTALGPAITSASVIAKHRNVGRVILLTDGLANEGIGALEGYQATPPVKYYEDLGHMFREAGAAVDVVGIASGAGMELKTLGLMPEATGGQMYYVTPNELDRSISELAGASMLGRDVEVRLITPPGVKVKDASGVSRAVVEELKTRAAGKIGVVGENNELYFEVEAEKEIKAPEVSIQVQVAYTDDTGARRVRAVTRKLHVSKDEKEIVKTLDPTIGATFVTQKAGEVAFGGDAAGGKGRITSFRAAMQKQAAAAPASAKAKFKKMDEVLASQEAEMDVREERMQAQPAAAPSGAADQSSTENLKQMRKSSKQLFEDEEK